MVKRSWVTITPIPMLKKNAATISSTLEKERPKPDMLNTKIPMIKNMIQITKESISICVKLAVRRVGQKKTCEKYPYQ